MHRRIEVTSLGCLGSCGRNVWSLFHANFGMASITTPNFPIQKAVIDSRSFCSSSSSVVREFLSCAFFPCGPLNCDLTGGSCWKGKWHSFNWVISTANCLSLLNAEEQSFTIEIVEVLTFFPFFSKCRCHNASSYVPFCSCHLEKSNQ